MRSCVKVSRCKVLHMGDDGQLVSSGIRKESSRDNLSLDVNIREREREIKKLPPTPTRPLGHENANFVESYVFPETLHPRGGEHYLPCLNAWQVMAFTWGLQSASRNHSHTIFSSLALNHSGQVILFSEHLFTTTNPPKVHEAAG